LHVDERPKRPVTRIDSSDQVAADEFVENVARRP